MIEYSWISVGVIVFLLGASFFLGAAVGLLLPSRSLDLNAEITAIKQEIQAEDDALAKNNDLQRYLNEIPDLVQFATGNKDAQMEILKRLGVAVLMYPEGEYKSVEWALVGNNMRLKGSPSSPLLRFGH